MQTLGGKIAKGPTAEEMKGVIRKIWKDIRAHPLFNQIKDQLLWSWDNAPVHHAAMKDWGKATSWNKLEGIGGELLWVPPWSPDLHQVIEHAHANTVRNFRDWLDANAHEPVKSSVMEYVDVIRKCFREGNTQAIVAAGVAKLQKVVYEEVIKAEGGYIPATHR